MDLKTLQSLRIVIPGSIILVFAYVLGKITGLFQLATPDLETLKSSLVVVVAGGLYLFTPLRKILNQRHAERVNENIRARMVSIAALPDDREKFTWSKIKRIFYDLIDHDESLKVKSQRVMFNGMLWTTAADITAISIMYLLYSLILVVSAVPNAGYAAIFFFVTGAIGWAGSLKTTKRHVLLGDEQLDLMEEKYASDIRARISAY